MPGADGEIELHDMEEVVVFVVEAAVGPDESDDGHEDERDAAGGREAAESLEATEESFTRLEGEPVGCSGDVVRIHMCLPC